MKEFKIIVPEEYPYILLCCIFIAFECSITNLLCVIRARIKAFPKDFMKQFGDEHRAAVGIYNRLEVGGFPDTGNGYYADKLSYKAWF